MKKIGLVLVLSILMTLFAPMVGASVQVPPEDGAYIVKLRGSGPDCVRLFSSMDVYEISGDAGLYRVDSYDEVLALGDSVEYCEPDAKATLFALTNDKYSSYQWNLEYIDVASAWDAEYTGDGVRVAIIDSGVNSMHEDFEGVSFERGANMMNGSRDVTDQMGHGTFIAGTLAAVSNNEKGIAGICEEITIIPIKCFGNSTESDTSYIVAGIYEAVDIYNCDVINLSLGVERNLTSMREAINYAVSKGVIVVSAVGNDGGNALNYPAAYENVIGVGAIESDGKSASFSQKNESVFVTAPGQGLIGLGHTAADVYVPRSRGSGTSYAVPHVVAAAVFLKEFNKGATVEDFKSILMASVTDAGDDGYDTSFGYGILNLNTFISVMESYEFNPIEEIFPDLVGHWAKDAIAVCFGNGYFKGVSSSSFEPEGLMSRGMFVTVLSRMSSEEISGFPNNFTDVPSGQFYTQACGWGSATGIVRGVEETLFNPGGNVTREQMAVFLYRYAEAYELLQPLTGEDSLAQFTDADSVSNYAREAMLWAVENGLITGRNSVTLDPGGFAKRCEVATIVSRFVDYFKI